MTDAAGRPAGTRARGRPRSTSAHELRRIGLRMFAEHGFENTTVAQIASEAGVTERTYFRYYSSKAALLWSLFESQKRALQSELDAAPDELPMMDALRNAVVAALETPAMGDPERRTLAQLSSDPALAALVSEYFVAWEHIVSDFAGRRLGQPPDSLHPVVVGRAVLAACRAAFEEWAAHPNERLASYLDCVLGILTTGFGSRS